eukprot:TRINITY_DN6741_c0_g4_i1.p1 TRINITY_DN6741_c0_g4~~TRINITY_DN6741_c0_g4_i1.p1  ORF type:complete len:290 (+),score=28.20 TRINITY_DN6741_c0_g4_i1:125-994(+)
MTDLHSALSSRPIGKGASSEQYYSDNQTPRTNNVESPRSDLSWSPAASSNSPRRIHTQSLFTMKGGAERLGLFGVMILLAGLLYVNVYGVRAFRRLDRDFLRITFTIMCCYAVTSRNALPIKDGVTLCSLVAVLGGVFLYYPSGVATVLTVILTVCGIPIIHSPPKEVIGNIFSLIPIALFSRSTWGFYKDVYSLIYHHSGNVPVVAYAGVAFVFVLQVFLSLLSGHIVSAAVNTGLSSTLSFSNINQSLLRDIPNNSPTFFVTIVTSLTIVSAWALRHNFPGTKGWFW